MEKNKLKTVILDQQYLGFRPDFIERNPEISLNSEITVISGVRRCGKSTLLHEIRSKLQQKDYYLNFDDERLIHFTVDDFQHLYELFIELFGSQNHFFFDEIQNIPLWERFVRRLHDHGNKVFITGSNASMLSRELGTHLTGRFIQKELYPFSFKEFIHFHKVDLSSFPKESTQGKAKLKKLFNDYFKLGGFPAYLKNNNREYLTSLYENILYRDVIVRNKLTNEKELLELIHYLAGNISRPVSYNNLAKIIGIKNASTIKNYLEYIQNTYLLFLVNKYDHSLKKQIQNPRKVYFIDNGLLQELAFHTSEDNGRMLENLVYIELKRKMKKVFYHKNKYECDFIIKEKNRILEAIQVCWSMYNENTRKREINGLIDALSSYNLKQGIILTENDEENLSINGYDIIIKPVWKWMLDC